MPLKFWKAQNVELQGILSLVQEVVSNNFRVFRYDYQLSYPKLFLASFQFKPSVASSSPFLSHQYQGIEWNLECTENVLLSLIFCLFPAFDWSQRSGLYLCSINFFWTKNDLNCHESINPIPDLDKCSRGTYICFPWASQPSFGTSRKSYRTNIPISMKYFSTVWRQFKSRTAISLDC